MVKIQPSGINEIAAIAVSAKAIGCLFLLNYSTLLHSNSTVPNDALPEVIRVYSPPYPTPTDATILAHRLLTEELTELTVAPEQLRTLSTEIESILSRIQNKFPELPKLSAWEAYPRNQIVAELKPELLEIIVRILGYVINERKTLQTGYVEFDALNAQLGLSEIQLLPTLRIAILHFSNSLKVEWASVKYSLSDGVEFAHPNYRWGDGSDIELQKFQGVWYVVFRHAWGDCPSGCIHQEFYFFKVNDVEVKRIEQNQAMNRSEFTELFERRQW